MPAAVCGRTIPYSQRLPSAPDILGSFRVHMNPQTQFSTTIFTQWNHGTKPGKVGSAESGRIYTNPEPQTLVLNPHFGLYRLDLGRRGRRLRTTQGFELCMLLGFGSFNFRVRRTDAVDALADDLPHKVTITFRPHRPNTIFREKILVRRQLRVLWVQDLAFQLMQICESHLKASHSRALWYP